MATETLRPNAVGDKSNLHPNAVVDNYTCVDETPSDDDTTYVSTDTNDQNPEVDLYNLPASAIGALDTINSVTVYHNVRSSSNTYKAAWKPACKTEATEYFGTLVNPTTTYTEYSKQYLVNPNTLAAWTLAEINALQIGSSGYSGKNPSTGRIYVGLCTQSWVVIDYTPAAGGLSIPVAMHHYSQTRKARIAD
jgi:hypothetical protein